MGPQYHSGLVSAVRAEGVLRLSFHTADCEQLTFQYAVQAHEIENAQRIAAIRHTPDESFTLILSLNAASFVMLIGLNMQCSSAFKTPCILCVPAVCGQKSASTHCTHSHWDSDGHTNRTETAARPYGGPVNFNFIPLNLIAFCLRRSTSFCGIHQQI